MVNIPIILLAAGGSTRMGQPKQLLPWGNKAVIEHQIQTLQNTGNQVSVVLGAGWKEIIPFVEKYNVPVFINEHWENGMGSSIALGVAGIIREYPESDGVLIALLDQPLVPPEHFRTMLEAFQPAKQQIVISSSSSGWKGVPVLFDKFYFNELQNLNNKEGAKEIIQAHSKKVTAVDCGNLLEDMDTPDKYRLMLKKFTSRT